MTTSRRFALPLVALCLVACLCLGACRSGSSGRVDPPGERASSAQPRTTQAAPPADLETTVAGNTSFAIDLYQKLAVPSGNIVFSPYSITTALAMTYAGARTTTASAFESTRESKADDRR